MLPCCLYLSEDSNALDAIRAGVGWGGGGVAGYVQSRALVCAPFVLQWHRRALRRFSFIAAGI